MGVRRSRHRHVHVVQCLSPRPLCIPTALRITLSPQPGCRGVAPRGLWWAVTPPAGGRRARRASRGCAAPARAVPAPRHLTRGWRQPRRSPCQRCPWRACIFCSVSRRLSFPQLRRRLGGPGPSFLRSKSLVGGLRECGRSAHRRVWTTRDSCVTAHKTFQVCGVLRGGVLREGVLKAAVRTAL